MGTSVSRETGGDTPPLSIARYEHARTGLTRFWHLLAGPGVERGLLGPREVPRLWERHILNCAVIEELIPPEAAVADVGSGAGLPGLAVALVRPDVTVTLVEPLARRCAFLEEAIAELGLGDRVGVQRGRAEDLTGHRFPVVTARAVAPLDRLAGWCLPLVEPNGRLIAIKGTKAGEELEQSRAMLPAKATAFVAQCGSGLLDPPTTVVVVDVTGSAS